MFLPRSFNLDLSTLIFQPQPFNPDYSNPNPYGVVVFMVESQGLKVGVENFGGWNVLQPIGKASPFQLIVMALLEIVLYETNEHIGRHYIKARINQIMYRIGTDHENHFCLHIELNLFILSPTLGH